MMTRDAACTRGVKYSIAVAQTAFNEKIIFREQTGFIFKEETSKMLYLEYIFVWCRNLDTSESNEKYLECSEM